jgi:hypothetical protein
MGETTARTDSAAARAVRGLVEIPATELANRAGAVTREVLRRGAAVITQHDEPVMVMMTVERYAELERAAAPDLDKLTRDFDALYARMQSPGVAERTIAALDLGARRRRALPAKRRKRRATQRGA